MAKVYLACEFQDFDPIEPRFVAVKHLQKKYSSQEGFVKCLVDEAKIASLLQHPNIVEVLDLGSVGTDFYLTMEWVNGKSLEKVFRALKQKKKFLSKSYLLYILREVAKGLHFAHEAKDSSGRPFDIVHCDISAQNILIGYDGSVLLSDFGIATAEKSQQEALAEVVLGKLSYMAPEQLSRKGFDRRADIYSFGVLLYEGLTYRKPFRMKNVHDLQQAIMKSQPDLSLPNIKSNPVLYDFIQRALSKNVDQRPSSILDFVNMTQDQDIARKEDIKSLMLALFEEEQKKETITRKLAIEQLTNQKEQELSALSLDDDDRDESLEGPREKTEIVSINPPNDVTRIALKKTDALGKVSLKQKPVLKAISNPVIVEQQTNSSSVALQTTNSHHSSASDLLQDGMDQLAESLQNETTDQQEKTELADFNFPEAQVEHTNQEDSWDKLRDAVKQELSQSKKQEPILTPDKPEKIHSTISDNKKLSKPKEKNIALESSGDEITLQIRITPSMLKNAIFFLFFVGIGFSLPYIFDTISKSQTSLLPVTQIQLFWSLEPYEKSLRVQHRYQDPDLIHDLYIKDIEQFFSDQHKKYTQSKKKPFEIVIKSIQENTPPINLEPSLISFFSISYPFTDLAELGAANLKEARNTHAKLFVHLYPKTSIEGFKYPIDLTERRPHRVGVVFLDLNDLSIEKHKVSIAHEISHALGAKDLFDRKGQADIPRGLADPNQRPLYPQAKGALMSRVLAVTATEFKPIESLDQASISPYTAKLLGWTEATKPKN